MQYLRSKFKRLWSWSGAIGDFEKEFSSLVKAYSEPWRKYHDLSHIEDCLHEFDGIMHIAYEPIAMELAIWYHDYIYIPKADNNELKSLEHFQHLAKRLRLPSYITQYAPGLFMATRHTGLETKQDEQIICDVDLSILGQADERFDEYERQIREEYKWVSDVEFKLGRTQILKKFLDMKSIYYTAFFRNKYECQARKNLARSIEKLSHP